jgi:phthiocerol/phenolphthiocerol synthesis type-I polyketide synthase E
MDRREISSNDASQTAIAVIGMSGAFPGAENLDVFWRNLVEGRECIRQLRQGGLEKLKTNLPSGGAHWVNRSAVLENRGGFDAEFFGFSAFEAQLMDPQQRYFLEHAWLALEDAALSHEQPGANIGVFAAADTNTYLIHNVLSHPDAIARLGGFQTILSNDKDFLATRVSYKLNLTGPSVSVQSACSSSLVAIILACQSLICFSCDAAVAGGVSIPGGPDAGYLYEPGGVHSPDGHCRAFDRSAMGTVTGSGVGVVILKRLEDALAANDPIRSVISGWGLNNDGARKVGFTAPSSEGQSDCVRTAMAMAEVTPKEIDFIECHGTGTQLGDGIELDALHRVFSPAAGQPPWCALGALKTNIGHAGAAAGVAGLIKTIYSLQKGIIPPNLHFTQKHPALEVEDSPFYIPATVLQLESAGRVRYAGVSSFGIGGTNAHVIVRQAVPRRRDSCAIHTYQVLPLSAKSKGALATTAQRLADYLESSGPDLVLEDTALTLQTGRFPMQLRRTIVASKKESAIAALRMSDCTIQAFELPAAAFLFPGQNADCRSLYRHLSTFSQFRNLFDHCASILRNWLDADLQELMRRDDLSTRTDWLQPALFAIEYCCAQMFMNWGIQPSVLLGHSLGELVAATIADVFDLKDALAFIAQRGRAMNAMMPPGGMLAVSLSENEIIELLPSELCLAAVNSRELCVVSGDLDALERFALRMRRQGISSARLGISRAFHSEAITVVEKTLAEALGRIRLNAPSIPILSNVTGNILDSDAATTSAYWLRQMREPVRFHACVTTMARMANIFLESGPGRVLTDLARIPDKSVTCIALEGPAGCDSGEPVMNALGQLWCAGMRVDWHQVHGSGVPNRISLPGYSFQRDNYWLESSGSLPARFTEQESVEPKPSKPDADSRFASTFPRSAQLGEPVPVETPLQATLVTMWEKLLGIQPIGIRDNFYDLGGHSLLAVQVLSRVRREFKVDLSLRTLLSSPTIAQLASAIEESIIAESSSEELANAIQLVASTIEESVARRVERKQISTGMNGKPGFPNFSVFFFSGDEEKVLHAGKYDFLLEIARYADNNGFEAVWVPDRHFHRFGGLYSNPSVIAGALALATKRISIRAGSVVLPARNPISVAEEWAIVDNLSGGRIGIALAPGFHPLDFFDRPGNYERRKELVMEGARTLQSLWRGEAMTIQAGMGNRASVSLFPKPVQRQPPLWLTAASSAAVFEEAAMLGAKVLTAALTLDFKQLAERVNRYWETWRKFHGDSSGGGVTVMLHSFTGEDDRSVRQTVRQPFIEYLRSHSELAKSLLQATAEGQDVAELTPDDENALLETAFERYYSAQSLMGTRDKCAAVASHLGEIGVTEIACLVDFGLPLDQVLTSLGLVQEIGIQSREEQEASA